MSAKEDPTTVAGMISAINQNSDGKLENCYSFFFLSSRKIFKE